MADSARINNHCLAVAELGGLLRAILYSACLPGWLTMRVSSKQYVPRLAETRNVSVVSQKQRVSSYKFFHALQSFRGGFTGRH